MLDNYGSSSEYGFNGIWFIDNNNNIIDNNTYSIQFNNKLAKPYKSPQQNINKLIGITFLKSKMTKNNFFDIIFYQSTKI